MGVMKMLDELEQELYEEGIIKLDKKDWRTPIAKSWFSKTQSPEDYTGLFEGIKLTILETDKTVTIKFDKTDENIYKSSMNGLKNTLEDVVSILREAKEEK